MDTYNFLCCGRQVECRCSDVVRSEAQLMARVRAHSELVDPADRAQLIEKITRAINCPPPSV